MKVDILNEQDTYDGPVPPPWDEDSAQVSQLADVASVSLEGAPDTRNPLDEAREWLGRFIIVMDDSDLDLLALWAAHTHLCDVLYTSPRLVIDSPVPGSGKTTVLEHLYRLCVNPIQAASLGSSALLVRIIDRQLRTILIDEADRSLHPKKEGVSELLAVVNSGYKRGATRPVLMPNKDSGWVEKEMKTFAPIAMAGNAPDLPEDTASRAIRVLLMPDVDDEAEESDWELIEPYAEYVGQRLAQWCESVSDQVKDGRPPLPPEIKGRSRERWSPLKRIAVVAGGRWPSVVDELALKEVELAQMDREDGLIRDRPHMVLARHLYELWPVSQEFYATADMVRDLATSYPEMWGESSPFGKPITMQRMGRMLASNFKVHSTIMHRGTPRGYTRGSMKRVWQAARIGEALDD